MNHWQVAVYTAAGRVKKLVGLENYFTILPREAYPGCQRLFMRGFWPKTCRPEANKAPHRTREKTSGARGTRGLLGGGNLFIDDVLIYVHSLCAKNY